jgi:hypothetical protein
VTALLVLAAVVLCAAVVLLAVAVRGRRVDNHPICRKCGFDLFGLDQAVNCPECGADLSADMISVGHRRVRRRLLAVGILLALPALALVATLITLNVRKTNFVQIKPVWWLLRDDDAEAAAELNRRLSLNKLSPAQISQITETALRFQANPKHTWLGGWGDFIEVARDSKSVSDAQWQRYAKQAAVLQLQARPNVRRGDKLPVRIFFSQMRIASKPDIALNVRIMHATIDDNPTRLG